MAKSKKSISFSINAELLQLLDDFAEDETLSRSQVIQKSIKKFLEEKNIGIKEIIKEKLNKKKKKNAKPN